MKIKAYCTSGGKNLIIQFINQLLEKEKLEGYAILEELEKNGLDRVLTKKIKGKLYEIKFYRYNRIFYVIHQKKLIYLLHACKKQKNKAEKKDINIR